MFKKLTHPAVLAGALVLTACQGFETQRAEKAPVGGSQFDRSLYSEYMDLSKWEWAQGDYRSADYYAYRAEASAKGQSVAPEMPSNRKLPVDTVNDIASARTRLTGQLAAGAAQKVPAQSAKAQAMLDCWMEQAEENRQPRDIAYCRDGYNTAMAEVDNAMRPPPVAAAPPPPAPMRAGDYVVFFDFNSDKLTPQAQDVIRTAVDNAKAGPGTSRVNIAVTGYTDTAGPEAYNQKLSELRSKAVAKMMEDAGIPANVIVTSGRGQHDLAVPTPDNVPNPGNRRATISIK